MRLLRPLAVSIALLLAAGLARAQQQSPLTFGLGGSVMVPLGDARESGFSDLGSPSFSPGWQGMGLFQIRPFGNTLGFQLDGTYVATDGDLPPARGQKYVLTVGAFFEVRGGKIARISNTYNFKDWLRQVQG